MIEMKIKKMIQGIARRKIREAGLAGDFGDKKEEDRDQGVGADNKDMHHEISKLNNQTMTERKDIKRNKRQNPMRMMLGTITSSVKYIIRFLIRLQKTTEMND